MPEEHNQNWYGYLTAENIKEVAELVRDFLNGKTFSYIIIEPINGITVNVQTSLELISCWGRDDPFRVRMSEAYSEYSIQISYDGGIISITTKLKEESHDSMVLNKTTYLSFEDDSLIIRQTINDMHIYMVISIQKPTPAMLDFASTLKDCLQDPSMPEEIKAKLQASAEAAKLITLVESLA